MLKIGAEAADCFVGAFSMGLVSGAFSEQLFTSDTMMDAAAVTMAATTADPSSGTLVVEGMLMATGI